MHRTFSKLAIIGAAFVALIGLPILITGQPAPQNPGGVVDDWSFHHLVFSNPGTFADAMKNGNFREWNKILNDPRFHMQQMKRNAVSGREFSPTTNAANGMEDFFRIRRPPPPTRKETRTLERDWSASLGSAGVAADMDPAKYQFFNGVGGTPSCSDYVVFGVDAAGASGSQPNIVGYTNLYVNAQGTGACTTLTAPTVLFSYYVGTGIVQTSPVLGPGVDQVAYVESISGGSKLHVLKGAGTLGSNGTIAAPVAPGSLDTALTICATSACSSGVSVTRSSPFYDYAHDVAYVGDDSGVLHKFTTVFGGTPAEVVTGGWPVTVSTATSKILTAPVYDPGSTLVFVCDSTGYLYSVTTTGSPSQTVVQSVALGSGAAAIEEAPIVDPTNERVYVFANGSSDAEVFELPAAFTHTTTANSANVGTTSTTVPMYAGDFNNTFYTTLAGDLYVCGNTGGNPTLYQVAISTSSPYLGTVTTGPVLANSDVACSPLTEFYNTSGTAVDWLFASVPSSSCGASATTAGGCVMTFNITSAAPTIGPWTPSTSFASNAEIVDTNGNIQKCTAGGCGEAGSTSGTATPAWTTSTTTDGTTANASAVGTVSGNSAVGGATVTIGSLTLTASAPTSASSPILINSTPSIGDTLTINGTVYDFHSSSVGCAASPEKCVAISGTTTTATDLNNAIAGTCFTGSCAVDPTVTATVSSSTVTIKAITPGTSANSDALATSDTSAIHINGGANSSTTLGAGTGTLGTNGSNTAPNFQYWSGSSAVSITQLAANIAGAITSGEQTSAGITLNYTANNAYLTITGAGANAGAAGNSVAVGGSLTGFAWTYNSSATTHLAGGTSALTWTYQSASNGQTTAAQATGASGMIIDNAGSAAAEANIYFGTLAGTGAPNDGVKMTQAGLH